MNMTNSTHSGQVFSSMFAGLDELWTSRLHVLKPVVRLDSLEEIKICKVIIYVTRNLS